MKKLFFVFLFLLPLIISTKIVFAVSCEDKPGSNLDPGQLMTFWDEVSKACDQQIKNAQQSQKSLKQAISTLNAKINLAQAQINQTNAQIKELEKEIIILEGVLETVNESMDDLSVIYLARVRESYRRSRVGPIDLIFTSENFADFFTRIKYLNTVKAKDQLILMELERSRLDYDARKQEKITKQEEVEKLKTRLIGQKNELDLQQKDKQNLLITTQNDEKRYLALLNEATAELNALLTSKFTEKRNVKKGDIIGLMGNTGFSTGAHLHFGVYNLKENEKFNYYASLNPIEYLISKSVFVEDDACDDVRNGGVTKNIGSGGHDWPMSTIRVTQCWGHTPYSYVYSNKIHDGLDIVDSAKTVRATDDGVAHFYRGTTNMGNNVRIFHPDGKMTLYLHLQ